MTMTAIVCFLSLYQEQVLGYSAIRTGLTLVPMTVVTAIGAIASQRMVPIFGPRMLIVVGGIVAAVGMAWLSRIQVHSDYASSVLGPTLVAGAGMSLMLVPIVAAATIGIDDQHAGSLSSSPLPSASPPSSSPCCSRPTPSAGRPHQPPKRSPNGPSRRPLPKAAPPDLGFDPALIDGNGRPAPLFVLGCVLAGQ